MWTSSLPNQSVPSSGDVKCNEAAKTALKTGRKRRNFRKKPCKDSSLRIEKTVEEVERSTLLALSDHFHSGPTSVTETKGTEPPTFRIALMKALPNETSQVKDIYDESQGPKPSLNDCSNRACSDSEHAASRQLQTVENAVLLKELYDTLKDKSELVNSLQTSEDLPHPQDRRLPKFDDLSEMTWPIFTSYGELSKRATPNPIYKQMSIRTEIRENFWTNDKKVGDSSLEFATLHEYLSRKPLHDQLFWKQFDEIFETVLSRHYTLTDLNILVTVYEKLNLELFEESERPTLAADTSERSVLADNLFCSVTLIEDGNERMCEVTPCWSSPEQYRLSESRFADFTRLQCLMVLSATCLLINADKRKFGALLAYGHLVKASYDALEHLLREADAGGIPIAPWRDRVAALLSYTYYKLYLQEEEWATFKGSYLEIMKLTRNAWSDAQLVGGRSTIETEWPKSWDDLLLAAEGYFADRLSLTGRELWRSAAIATLCLDARIRKGGSADESSTKMEILEALERFAPVIDPVLKAVLSLKRFQFCYRTQWNISCQRLEDVYSKKSLDAFQQDVGCVLVHYSAIRVCDAPPWVMVRFRSQFLETAIGHIILLVIRNDKDSLKVGVKVLEDLILDDFIAPDGNVDTDESAHLRLASQSMFYFLTGQMSGRPPDSPAAPYDGHFALAVYSKLYVRKCVAIDSVFSLAIQAFEGPIDAFLKKDNAEKELLSTLFLLMPMLYERFNYECALMEIKYSPKRLSSLSWLEIADERQLTKVYNKLRKVAQGKETEIKKDISIHLGIPRDIEEDDALVQKEFGTIKAEYCSSCNLTDTANKSVDDRTPSQSLDVSTICIDGKSTLCQGVRGTLYIRNDCSGQNFPSYREAAPKTKAFIKTSSMTETCLNQSRLDDEIISLEHIGNKLFSNCAPVLVLQPDEYFFIAGKEEIDLLELSSIDPCFLESSRMGEDFEFESETDLITSAVSCKTLTSDSLQNPLTWTSAISSEDYVEHVTNEMDVHPILKSPNATVKSFDETKTLDEFGELSMKLDNCPVRSDEVKIFLSNAFPSSAPGQIEWPLEKVRAALCNSLLRIRNSNDWTEWKGVFKTYEREKFEAAVDEMLQTESGPPLKHLVDLFDFVTTVMKTFLCKDDPKEGEMVR